MKKVIWFFLLLGFFFSFSLAFADVLPPFEDQCAKYITTDESIIKSKACMANCLIGRYWNTFFCEKYSCWDGRICLYTNKDKKELTHQYLNAEKGFQRSMIIKNTIVILLCAGVFIGTFIYRKRNKKDV